MATITFSALSKRFGDVVAVHPLDLEIADGALTVLVGPSGCGKTTCLRMIAGLEEATDGDVFIDDRNVTRLAPKDRNVSMVFQNFALYPHLSVGRNIGFPLEATRTPKPEAQRRTEEAAALVGLDHLLDRRPKALSGGQQQRVAIARAMVRQPAVFLLDEPLSNLDAKLRVETRKELLRLQRRLAATMVYVTHDQEEAMILADDLVVMRDGRVMQRGRPYDVYHYPANEFVARFIGSPEINLWHGEVHDGRFVADDFELDLPGVPDGPLMLGVRPDDIRREGVLPAERETALFTATVEVVELRGATAVLSLDLNGHEVRVVIGESELEDIEEGNQFDFACDARRLHLFDHRSGTRLGEHARTL